MEKKELIERLEKIRYISDFPCEYVEKRIPEHKDYPYPAAIGIIGAELFRLIWDIEHELGH